MTHSLANSPRRTLAKTAAYCAHEEHDHSMIDMEILMYLEHRFMREARKNGADAARVAANYSKSVTQDGFMYSDHVTDGVVAKISSSSGFIHYLSTSKFDEEWFGFVDAVKFAETVDGDFCPVNCAMEELPSVMPLW